MWTDVEWETMRELLQRVARLEEAVNNHIPTRIAGVERSINALHGRMWAIVIGVLLTGLGVWLNYSILIRARVL